MRDAWLTQATALLLLGCGAPDYSPVRDWAATATLAADYAPVADGRPAASAQTSVPSPVTAEDQRPSPLIADGILAMQEALVTYFAALGTIAADGVLAYPEDPFTTVATRAARASEASGLAIAKLGALLHYAGRSNARAPQLRDTIHSADPHVQTLASDLARATTSATPREEQERAAVAARYAELARAARDAATRRTLQDLAVLLDREFGTRAAARLNYAEVVRQIGEGHALLTERSRHLGQEETARQVRAAENRLRRAAALLPREGMALARFASDPPR
jgi:hypothetical protein